MALTNSDGLLLDIEPDHQPVEIEAQLRTGVGYDQPYGLDLAGLLASRMRAVQRAELDHVGQLHSKPLPDTADDTADDMDLPLSRCITGADWHWLATCVLPQDAQEHPEPRTFYRTVDSSWAQRAASRPLTYFHPSSGPYRDIMMPAPVVVCSRVCWRAVGNPDALRRLLAGITFIGRRRMNGEGGVLTWTVRPIDASLGSWAHLAGRRIARPCPPECAQALHVPNDEWRLGWYALRPPSWHPDRLTELAMTVTDDDW